MTPELSTCVAGAPISHLMGFWAVFLGAVWREHTQGHWPPDSRLERGLCRQYLPPVLFCSVLFHFPPRSCSLPLRMVSVFLNDSRTASRAMPHPVCSKGSLNTAPLSSACGSCNLESCSAPQLEILLTSRVPKAGPHISDQTMTLGVYSGITGGQGATAVAGRATVDVGTSSGSESDWPSALSTRESALGMKGPLKVTLG